MNWINVLPPETQALLGGVLGIITGVVLVLSWWAWRGRR